MKQPWQLLGEIPGDDPEVLERLRSIVAQLGAANSVADRVASDAAGCAASSIGRDQAAAAVSYQVFVQAGPNTIGDERQDWAFFLVTRPRGGQCADAASPGVIQVFLYPAVPAVRGDANTAPGS